MGLGNGQEGLRGRYVATKLPDCLDQIISPWEEVVVLRGPSFGLVFDKLLKLSLHGYGGRAGCPWA